MVRRRLVVAGFVGAILAGLLFWPVVMGYTLTAGEKAAADVAECHSVRTGKTTKLVCTGTWRTHDGHTGSGEIYGLDRDDAGRTGVPVRIGPMGPYAGGFARNGILFIGLIPLVLAAMVLPVFVAGLAGPGRTIARRLLAEPGDGLVVLIGRKDVCHPDGRPYATRRTAKPPPGYSRLELPGRHRRNYERSTLEVLAGISRDATTFSALYGSGGEPLMLIERRTSKDYQPESVMLDATGTAKMMVRRTTVHPTLRYTLLSPDGQQVGSAEPVGSGATTMKVMDVHGREVATIARLGRRWVLRAVPSAPPLLRDAAITLTFSLIGMD